MKTDKPKKKRKLVAASLLLVFAIGFFLTLSHWWLRVSTARITYNSKPSSFSRLYRSRSGELVLRLEEPNEFAYWITPKDRKVYSPKFSNFSFFSFATFVEHNDQYGVDLEYTAKTDIHPNIVAGTNFMEFTSLREQRVQVSW